LNTRKLLFAYLFQDTDRQMAKILIIDDDEMMNRALARAVSDLGHETLCALTLAQGMGKISADHIDVVFLDVRLPDGSGIAAISQIRESQSRPEVIIITGFGDRNGAELAIRSGAWDYIQKPCTADEMLLPLRRALEYRQARQPEPPRIFRRNGIVGTGTGISEAIRLSAQAAAGDMPVLLCGETGTGKELFARAIHASSSRSAKPFVTVDCAALPESLAESLLFGHEKGSFTGADRKTGGLIAKADGGTLFLDEIGELPLAVQKTFLRVLQEHSFLPVGAEKMYISNFRTVSASNRNPDEMVQNGMFRPDLLFRIRGFSITLPRLRERKEDIRELLMHCVNRACESRSADTKGFTSEFLQMLCEYDWPGNVREFIHAVEESLARAADYPILYPQHLPPHIRVHIAQKTLPETPQDSSAAFLPVFPETGAFPSLKQVRSDMENHYLRQLMLHVQGKRSEACRISGLSRTRLFEMMKKYGIE